MCSHVETYTQCRIPFCYTGRRACAGATYPCCAIREHVIIDSTCENKWHRTLKFAGAVRYNVPKSCAALLSPRGPSLALRAIHLVSRLRRVADMCSSRVTELRIGKRKGRTRSRSVLMRGKILCRSSFSKRSPVYGLRQTKK